MACSLATAQANACTSGIGKETNPIELLQLTAQAAATWAALTNPALAYTVAAIQDRACTSGIGKLTDQVKLLNIIAQNLCHD